MMKVRATVRSRQQRDVDVWFWNLNDDLRSRGLEFRDYIGLFAALLMLRLAEEEDKERVAVAEFDGKDFHSDFPKDAHWERINIECVTPHHLVSHLRERVWPALRLCHNGTNHLALIPRVVDLERLPLDVVVRAVRHLSEWSFQDISSRADLAAAFQEIIEKFVANDPAAGQFTTPLLIRDLMVQIASPKPGESVYDPCFGTAGLLAAAVRHMQENTDGSSVRMWERLQPAIFGVEATPLFCLVGAVRLMLEGVSKPRVTCGDALEMHQPNTARPTFDCILADLPFGQKIERQIGSQYRFSSTSGDALFVQHILSALKPGGRAVILVPQSFLFRRGAERQIREWLIREHRLDCVVALPAVALKPYSGIACSLLVIHRQPPRNDVLFIDDGQVAFIHGYQGVDSLRSRLLTLALRVRQGIAGKPEEVRMMLNRLLPPPDQGSKSLTGDEGDENNKRLGELIRYFLDPGHLAVPDWWRTSFVPVQRLATRDWELLEKEAGLEKLEDFLSRIRETLPETTVLPLGECAEVLGGVPYTRRNTESDFLLPGERGADVKLVRVQDLLKTDDESEHVHFLFSASRKFIPHVGARVSERQFLRDTDIVVSIGGTVGKVALAGKGIERTVVSNGLAVIRCKEPLLGHYIAYLLLTEPYQEWLDSHTTGSVIRHLRLSVLRELRIPVVPRAAQLAVVQSGRARHNPESFLNLLAQREGASPWLTFLLEAPEIRAFNRAAEHELTFESGLPLLARLLEASKQLDEKTREVPGADMVANWLLAWGPEISRLIELLQMPLGLVRYTSLQAWLTRFTVSGAGHLKAVEGLELERRHGPNSKLLEAALGVINRLNSNLTKLVHAECEQMVEPVKLSASVTPSVINAGMETDVTLAVRNEALLPLPAVTVMAFGARVAVGAAELGILDPERANTFTCKLRAHPTGVMPIELHWFADRVNLTKATGVISLAVEVQTLRDAVRTPRLTHSPYVVGNPLDPEENAEMFFGREDVINSVRRALRTEGASTVILLEGNRRVGKSSLLARIAASELPGEWLPVYANFQKFDGHRELPGVPTELVFYGIAKAILLAAARVVPGITIHGNVVPTQGASAEQRDEFLGRLRKQFQGSAPFEQLQTVVEVTLQAIAPRRVLLMLDEFDKLQEGIESGATSPQVPENLRNLFHSYSCKASIPESAPTLSRLLKVQVQ